MKQLFRHSGFSMGPASQSALPIDCDINQIKQSSKAIINRQSDGMHGTWKCSMSAETSINAKPFGHIVVTQEQIKIDLEAVRSRAPTIPTACECERSHIAHAHYDCDANKTSLHFTKAKQLFRCILLIWFSPVSLTQSSSAIDKKERKEMLLNLNKVVFRLIKNHVFECDFIKLLSIYLAAFSIIIILAANNHVSISESTIERSGVIVRKSVGRGFPTDFPYNVSTKRQSWVVWGTGESIFSSANP